MDLYTYLRDTSNSLILITFNIFKLLKFYSPTHFLLTLSDDRMCFNCKTQKVEKFYKKHNLGKTVSGKNSN